MQEHLDVDLNYFLFFSSSLFIILAELDSAIVKVQILAGLYKLSLHIHLSIDKNSFEVIIDVTRRHQRL